jgi:hypothetical protein
MVYNGRGTNPAEKHTKETTNMEFKKTNERIRVTTGDWDGTGYNGEAKERPVYISNDGQHKGKKFIKARFNGIWSYLEVLETLHQVSGEREVRYFDDCKEAR